MTQTSYPYVDQATTDIEYSRLFREFEKDGVAASIGSSVLAVTATGTSMTVTVAPGGAVIRGYMFRNNDPQPLTIPAASTSARVDRIIIELNLSIPNMASRAVLKVLQGTPGSSTPAALVQTDAGIYQISLAKVAVGGNAVTIPAASITDERPWVGIDVSAWKNNDGRPVSPRKYTMGFNEASGIWEYYNGSTWVSMAPAAPTWASLSGKPSTFTPSAHSHSASQISDPQNLPISWSQVSGKPATYAPSAHTHVASAISAAEQLKMKSGDSDKVNGIKVYVQATEPTGAAVNSLWFW